jgi:hypothetical protein
MRRKERKRRSFLATGYQLLATNYSLRIGVCVSFAAIAPFALTDRGSETGNYERRERRENWKSTFFVQIFPLDFAILKNLGEKTAPNGFAPVHGHYGASPVRVAQKVVASLDPHNFEPKAFEQLDKTGTSDGRKVAHTITATRCTPTNWFKTGCSTSRHSSMASLILFIKTSRDLACVWQPRRAGTEATKYPSSSFSITTLKSLVISAPSFHPCLIPYPLPFRLSTLFRSHFRSRRAEATSERGVTTKGA